MKLLIDDVYLFEVTCILVCQVTLSFNVLFSYVIVPLCLVLSLSLYISSINCDNQLLNRSYMIIARLAFLIGIFSQYCQPNG